MAKVFNPYIAGNPIRKETDFFGRKNIIDRVRQELSNPSINSIVLSGQRRIGKTSLLLQLENRLPEEDFLAIYFDLQDQAVRPLGEVLADLADTITRKINTHVLNIGFDDSGKSFTESFLPELYKILGERRLVILLDEFDVVDQVGETDSQQIPAAKGLFPFLRNLTSIDTNLAFVFVVGRRVDDLHINTISLFKTAISIDVWLLDPDSLRKLILKAEENGTIQFDNKAVERVVFLANGHPYLTQLICQRVWNSVCLKDNVSYPVVVTEEMIDASVQDSISSGDAALRWIWDGLGPAEKIFASALAELSQNGIEISEDEIAQVLAANAMRLRSREIEVAPKDLVQRKILVPATDNKYKFAVELFRIWVEKNHSIKDVKDELDRIEPEADGLYQLGSQSLKRHQNQDAMEYFQKALEKNQNHFQARLGLGEALLENGEVDSAVRTLRYAYSLDAKEAKFPLVRALLTQAKDREKQGYLSGVVESCEAILKITPSEETALEMGTRAKRLLDFNQRMDAVIDRSDQIVKERTPSLVTILSENLAKKIINYAIKPALYDWRDQKLRTLNDVKFRIKNLIADWLASDDAKLAITNIVSPWLNGISHDILSMTKAIYKDLDLHFEGIRFAEDMGIPLDQNISADGLQIDFDNTVGVIVGTVVGIILGALILILTFTPPIGELLEIITGIFMALLSIFGLGAYIGDKIKDGFEKLASDKDIPGFLRTDLLSDGKIRQILYTGEDRIREQLEKSLNQNLAPQVEVQISENIRSFLNSQKEKTTNIIR